MAAQPQPDDEVSTTPEQGGAASGGVVSSFTGALSAAGTTITSTATSAYQQAPDLGLTSTAQAALNKVSGATAETEQQQSRSSASDTTDVQPNGQEAEGDHEALGGPAALKKRHEERMQQSKEAGPSSPSRVGKSQTEIGVEDNIPTAAGAGTTQPQDSTVQTATSKKPQASQANVPADFEDVDSPSQFAGGQAKQGASSSSPTSAAGDADKTADTNTDAAASSSSAAVEKRSWRQKIKDRLKGEVKVISGTVKRDQEKVQQGKVVKKGQA